MKCCPLCQNRYTDETLRFCLQDGTPLADESARQSSIDTVAFSHPLTAGSILQTGEINLNPQRDWDKTQALKEISHQRAAAAGAGEVRKLNIFSFVLPGLLLVSVFGGVGSWFYFSNRNAPPPRDVATVSPENTGKTLPANQAVVSDTVVPEKAAQEEAKVNSEQIKNEVAAQVGEWAKLAEARNLPGYMSKYAETVDYHDKNGARLSDVRAEMQKIFTSFEKINITLTNVKIAVDAEGKKATAVFDKDWEYENVSDLSEGKAHTRLHFQKEGSVWKITGEKYLEIYDMEN